MGTGIWLVYILCILAALLCVGYGIVNWNKGDETPDEVLEDKSWANEEKKIEKEFE
jgi:hypothetical protein